MAGPIFDHTGTLAAAFSISGPANRLTREKIEEISELIVDYSRRISRAFGHNEY